VVLDVLQEFADADLVRLEVNTLAIAEAKVDRGAPADGLAVQLLEPAPGAEDLAEPPLLRVVRILVDLPAPFPVFGGPIELAAVLEDRRQGIECLLAVTGLGLVGDGLVD